MIEHRTIYPNIYSIRIVQVFRFEIGRIQFEDIIRLNRIFAHKKRELVIFQFQPVLFIRLHSDWTIDKQNRQTAIYLNTSTSKMTIFTGSKLKIRCLTEPHFLPIYYRIYKQYLRELDGETFKANIDAWHGSVFTLKKKEYTIRIKCRKPLRQNIRKKRAATTTNILPIYVERVYFCYANRTKRTRVLIQTMANLFESDYAYIFCYAKAQNNPTLFDVQ